jgi:hypothetical protein
MERHTNTLIPKSTLGERGFGVSSSVNSPGNSFLRETFKKIGNSRVSRAGSLTFLDTLLLLPTKMPIRVTVRIMRRLCYNIYARTVFANIREKLDT